MCSVAMENMSSLARNSVATEYTTSVMRIREHTYVMLQQDAWRLLWNNTKLTVLIFFARLPSSSQYTGQDSVLPVTSNPGVRIAISNDQQNNAALPLRIVIMQIIKITRSPAALEIHMQKVFCIRSDPGVRNAISNELPIRCRSSK